jgi:DNA replication protein DnaC
LNTVRECQCARERRLRARIRTILEDWKEYQEATIENFIPRTAAQERAIAMLRGSPYSSFFIRGIYSQGKTRLLVCQYRYLAERGIQCELRTAKELISELQAAEAPVDPGKPAAESPVLKLVNSAPRGHLFIDDIEKAAARSGFRAEALFTLFDTMKRRQIGLTFTSNLAMKDDKHGRDLIHELTNPIVSRLDTLCPDTLNLG